MNLLEHPTVRRLSASDKKKQATDTTLNGAWLRRLALDCGAHDSGVVELARPGLDSQRDEILRNYPWTRSLLSFVVRMAREPVRGAPRSVAVTRDPTAKSARSGNIAGRVTFQTSDTTAPVPTD